MFEVAKDKYICQHIHQLSKISTGRVNHRCNYMSRAEFQAARLFGKKRK